MCYPLVVFTLLGHPTLPEFAICGVTHFLLLIVLFADCLWQWVGVAHSRQDGCIAQAQNCGNFQPGQPCFRGGEDPLFRARCLGTRLLYVLTRCAVCCVVLFVSVE